MDALWQDVRYSCRLWLKNPGFTATVVLALSLGIGANSAIFSVVNTVLLRPLPYQDPGRLVALSEIGRGQPRAFASRSVAPANFVDWRDQAQAFEQMAAFDSRGVNMTDGGEAERIRLTICSASFFQLLGAQPSQGRTFWPKEDQPGRSHVVVISHGLWQRRFGSDPRLLGKPLTIDGATRIVVGIVPAGFDFPAGTDVWTPPRRFVPEAVIDLDDITKVRALSYLNVIARLKPHVSINQAQGEMVAIGERLGRAYPRTNAERRISVVPLQESLVGDVRVALLVLLAAVGSVLLIACANVANLLLARATSRYGEIGLRRALGASQPRVFRQLLTESVLLALPSGALGLVLAHWGVGIFVALGAADIPRLKDVSVDGSVLVWTLMISLLSGILFGLAPAWQTLRPQLTESIKEGGIASSGGVRRNRGRGVLVITEVALALMLLIAGGLSVRSFQYLRQVNVGFDPQNLLTVRVAPAGTRYWSHRQQVAFYKRVLDRIEALPGVQAVGAIDSLPISGIGSFLHFVIEGRDLPSPPSANYRMVSPSYFRAMGIPLLKGRLFTDRDDLEAPGVVIINETLARSFFPDEDPIGRRIRFNTEASRAHTWLEIVSVVRDVRTNGPRTDVKPEVYQPYLQRSWPAMSFVIRSSDDPRSVASAARRAVQAIDKDQPVSSLETMSQIVANSLGQPRFNMLLVGIFGTVALVLAAVGIYGVMAYSVTQRAREIGIRLALGAQQRDVLRLIVTEGMELTLAGVVIGLAGAFVLTRLAASLLYGLSARDPLTFAGAAMVLGLVALLACLLPARRATQVDPVVTLKFE